jgi:hypothetical protein
MPDGNYLKALMKLARKPHRLDIEIWESDCWHGDRMFASCTTPKVLMASWNQWNHVWKSNHDGFDYPTTLAMDDLSVYLVAKLTSVGGEQERVVLHGPIEEALRVALELFESLGVKETVHEIEIPGGHRVEVGWSGRGAPPGSVTMATSHPSLWMRVLPDGLWEHCNARMVRGKRELEEWAQLVESLEEFRQVMGVKQDE